MKPSGSTHRACAVPPEQFRAQATGVGQSRSNSLFTGSMRAQRVRDCMPSAQAAAVPEAEGYPPATPTEFMSGAAAGYRHRY